MVTAFFKKIYNEVKTKCGLLKVTNKVVISAVKIKCLK